MSAALSSLHPIAPAPVSLRERCSRRVRFSPESIADFARASGDTNPLHVDVQAAARSRHGRLIASGQQTTSQLIGLAASYFSRGREGAAPGEMREVLSLNFNFSLKQPVFADEDVDLAWTVSSLEWSGRLQGWLVQADGSVTAGERLCVVARATLLIKAFADN